MEMLDRYSASKFPDPAACGRATEGVATPARSIGCFADCVCAGRREL